MPEFKRVEILKRRILHPAEHEVFLSFDDDDGAEAFLEWWMDEGAELLGQWCAESDEFNSLVDGY